ncbi:MAG: carboxypeptidase regulatory-like domain-containing protein [Chloroflexi bacterium]|nr:carboxypeptidase regulatory-like domain-containing protein [Chloroflexota bacterium]
MKHTNRFFKVFALLALFFGALGGASTPAAAAEPFVCIPTCSVVDSRMLTLASVGYETLAGQTISLRIAVPASMSTFEIGIFDGDTGGTWDLGTTSLIYTLYADPSRTGSTSVQLAQWLGGELADNAWTDKTFTQDAQAMSPGGDYFYHMEIVLPNAATVNSLSNFKIRSDAPVELALDESFAFTAAFYSAAEARIVYPQYPASLTETTYDGTWDIYFTVSAPSQSIVVYDGDMDYGSYDCVTSDTNDPDTPDDSLPLWSAGISDVFEGVAFSAFLCRNAAGAIITGPAGQTNATGYPADDSMFSGLRRSPSVIYTITDSNGVVYHNDNPSGNKEWEQFRIETNTAIPADHYVDDLLPSGIYRLHLVGLDLSNLNALHLNYDMLCVYENGAPCIPVLHPYKLGDTVWYDINGNGTQEDGEPGIPGVAVTLLDSNGLPLPNGTAVTDANGNYTFSVESGDYTVQIDSGNFGVGGALAGYNSTTGGNAQTNTVTADNVLTYDFGFRGTAAIGDRVWEDLNGNGLQDADEPGVEGASVQLLGSDGLTVLVGTTTDASGNYSFANLTAGSYTVQFSLPSGASYTTVNAGDDGADSDADAVTGKSSVIVLAPGQVDSTIDAGLRYPVDVNYCGFIRSPGFWKNYKNHMSTAVFQNLITHTQDFSYLTAKQAVAILSKNSGVTRMGIPALDGVNASYLKFLLSAELNAVWNGQDNAADLGGTLGIGIYQGTSLTVNQVLYQAYESRRSYSSAQLGYLTYLGSNGEDADANSCLVQP